MANTATARPRGLRGSVLSFSAAPQDLDSPGVDHLDDAVVLLKDGRVERVLATAAFEREGGDPAQCEDLRGSLILPGFIDTHIHYSQMAIIASYGTQLLDWLQRYAFPAELAFAAPEHAAARAEAFLARLFANGTTTALTFTTVHPGATDALFAAAAQRNVCLIAGKVLMNRFGPDGLLDDAGGGIAESEALIERWHGQGRLRYAVTPRFAITCTAPQLEAAGALLARHPGVYLHTHLSEHPNEVTQTLELFPEAADYVDVYDRFGMVGPTSVFAHGIHLSDRELTRLAEAGAAIAFCPTSNLFLGSGLLDLERLARFGVKMSVASDVGGGTSYSMLTTLGEGYKVAQLGGYSWHPAQALHAATRGNAVALGLEDRIGQVAEGFDADLAVLRPAAGSVLEERMSFAENLTDKLFAYQLLGDESAVARCYVAGQLVHQRAEG
ncbi:MAG: guanine deaminase [Pseudomonadota bacterium]